MYEWKSLQFLQLCKIHTQSLLTMLPLKLHLNELCAALHFAFEDDAFAKHIMTHFIASFEPLSLRLDGFQRGCL